MSRGMWLQFAGVDGIKNGKVGQITAGRNDLPQYILWLEIRAGAVLARTSRGHCAGERTTACRRCNMENTVFQYVRFIC